MPILSTCEVGPSHISLLLNPITIPISELENNRLSRTTNFPPQKTQTLSLKSMDLNPVLSKAKPFHFSLW